MILSIDTPWQPNAWNDELQKAFRHPEELLTFLGLTDANADPAPQFPMLVPRNFAKRMQPTLSDPLLQQVLPQRTEQEDAPGFVKDPLNEHANGFNKAPALIQKYHGRALLLATPACAVNCRYCFRRHFPYAENRPGQHNQALLHIKSDPSISEVILSGGDPLLLSDRPFSNLIDSLNDIAHVARIRIHSRIPIVLPERANAALLETLSNSRARVILVTHANHPAELDTDTEHALACYRAAGLWLFNQAVLLRGVNDNHQVQIELAHALFEQGVLPYYLHLPDRVAGTHHFFVNLEAAQVIYRKMQAALPGYLLPKLVREEPGAQAKTPVNEIGVESPTI